MSEKQNDQATYMSVIKSKNLSRANNFALLHICAAVMVVFGHTFTLLGKTPPQAFGEGVQTSGVNILFCISGFLVMGSYLRCKHGAVEFYMKRLKRLYPPYFFTLLATVLLLSLDTTVSQSEYWSGAKGYFLNNAMFRTVYKLPGVFLNNPYADNVNGPLWSLPYEVFFYLLLPLCIGWICKLYRKAAPWVSGGLYAFLAVVFMLELYPNGAVHILSWSFSYALIARMGAYFFAGVFFSTLSSDIRQCFCQFDYAFVLFVLIICLGEYYPRQLNVFWLPYFTISMGLGARPVANEIFNKNDVAYEIYLYALPFQQLITEKLYVDRGLNWHPCIYFLINIIVIVCVAWIANKSWEKAEKQIKLCYMSRRGRRQNEKS